MTKATLARGGALAALGVVAALLVSEGVVRVAYPHARDHVVPAGLLRMDPALGWTLAATTNGRHTSGYFDTTYSINALGFRDPPRAATEPAGEYRVLLYGDSQIFGWGIPVDQRFSRLLERRAAGLEIWNLGVPGYGLDQEVLAYERQRADADEAVFFVSESTLSRTRTGYVFKKYKPRFVLGRGEEVEVIGVPARQAALIDVAYRLISRFYLPYFLELQVGAWQRLVSTPPGDRSPGAPADSSLGELELRMLRRAQRTATARGQQMTVLTDLPAESRERLRRFAAEHGIGVLEVAIDRTLDDMVLGPQDRHWSSRAQELIAAQLWPQLQARLATGERGGVALAHTR